ncbi:MAG: hypothetical protein FWF70_05345 [Bacteroidetes bacterium]|nr:hypothetical protein [Bacteroidota bacterium]MCL1969274.1 hypothetical protein [Bacteroidota bacterium]
MKKVLLLCMAVCLLLLGCEKEGVYNPDKKIKRISYQSLGDVKRLAEEWTWDKSLLKTVQYFTYDAMPSYDERYSYEKNRLVKVEDNDGYYYKITYQNDQYNKVEYYDPLGIPFSSMKFTYENKKISKIVMTELYDDGSKSLPEQGFIARLLPPELIRELNKMNSFAKGKEVVEGTTYITLKWNNNNISEIITESSRIIYGENAHSKTVMTFEKYDTKENPLYHSFADIVGSKNNPLEVITKSELTHPMLPEPMLNRFTSTYEYEYNGKFPTQIIETQKYANGDYGRMTTFYEYK